MVPWSIATTLVHGITSSTTGDRSAAASDGASVSEVPIEQPPRLDHDHPCHHYAQPAPYLPHPHHETKRLRTVRTKRREIIIDCTVAADALDKEESRITAAAAVADGIDVATTTGCTG